MITSHSWRSILKRGRWSSVITVANPWRLTTNYQLVFPFSQGLVVPAQRVSSLETFFFCVCVNKVFVGQTGPLCHPFKPQMLLQHWQHHWRPIPAKLASKMWEIMKHLGIYNAHFGVKRISTHSLSPSADPFIANDFQFSVEALRRRWWLQGFQTHNCPLRVHVSLTTKAVN